MFSWLVGQVSIEAAIVLVAMFAAIAVTMNVFLAMFRSRRSLEMQFEVDKTKLHNEDMANKRTNDRTLEYDMARLATERDVQFKRIETGMIEGKVNPPKSDYDR